MRSTKALGLCIYVAACAEHGGDGSVPSGADAALAPDVESDAVTDSPADDQVRIDAPVDACPGEPTLTPDGYTPGAACTGALPCELRVDQPCADAGVIVERYRCDCADAGWKCYLDSIDASCSVQVDAAGDVEASAPVDASLRPDATRDGSRDAPGPDAISDGPPKADRSAAPDAPDESAPEDATTIDDAAVDAQ